MGSVKKEEVEEEEEKLKKVKKTNKNLEEKLRGNYKTQ